MSGPVGKLKLVFSSQRWLSSWQDKQLCRAGRRAERQVSLSVLRLQRMAQDDPVAHAVTM